MKRRIVSALRYHWLLLLLGLALGGAAGYYLTSLEPPLYAGTTRLLLGQSGQTLVASEPVLASEYLLSTNAELVSSYPVLAATITQLSLPFSPETLAGRIEASPLPRTELLELTVLAENPELAAQIANALAQQLIIHSPAGPQSQEALLREDLQRQIGELDSRIALIGEELAALEREIQTTSSEFTMRDLQQRRDVLIDRRENWRWLKVQADIQATSLAGRATSLSVIDEARPQPAPVYPHPLRNGLLAALGGLLLAWLLALAWERYNTLSSADEVSGLLAKPIIGSIPKLASLVDERGRLVISQDPNALASDSYRSLALNLHFFNPGQASRSFVVSSSASGEGTTTILVNLAVAMAQSGSKVVLVDANVHKPMHHRIFELDNSAGLTTMLSQDQLDSTSRRAIVQVMPNLSVIPSGPPVDDLDRLLVGERMDLLLWILQEEAEIVLFDAPPALLLDDAVELARRAGSVLLVVETGRTRRSALRRSHRRFQKAGASVLGVILNKVDEPRDAYQQARDRRSAARRARQRAPARVSIMTGLYLLCYGGGHYADIAYEIEAARGDNVFTPAALVELQPSALNSFVVPDQPAGSDQPFVAPRLNQTLGGIAPSTPPALVSPALTRVQIPKIGLDSKVIEVGQELVVENGRQIALWQVARYSVGHHQGSAYPGDGENIVLAGHVAGAAHVFRDLILLEPGDQLTLYSQGRSYLYLVGEKLLVREVGVSDEERMQNARYIEPAGEELVTLITCWPPSGPNAFSQRVIVRARPYGAGQFLDASRSAWTPR